MNLINYIGPTDCLMFQRVKVKLGDTLAVFVKPCRSCRTNSCATCIFLHDFCSALHTILNGYIHLTTMGVQFFYVG